MQNLSKLKTKTLKPIKRHLALQNLSREHHDALVFALRLQKGVAKKADLLDMKAYADWFWEDYLAAHFKLEEEFLFPLLGKDHKLVLKAQKQHQQLKSLFELPSKSYSDFEETYAFLQHHIRFEERELFNLMQEEVAEKDLLQFEKLHSEQKVCSFWENQFWK